VRETVKLWVRHHLTYDQTKHVVENARRELRLAAPKERRRTVDRLGRMEIERLIETAYRRASSSGLMVKTLFYTGARVSEFVNLRVEDLHLASNPPQIYIAHAKGGSDGYVSILPALTQELRTHLAGRRTGYLFESNRHDRYTPRAIQLIVQDTAKRAGIEKRVTPTACGPAAPPCCWMPGCRWIRCRSSCGTSASPPPRFTPRLVPATWARAPSGP